jgi:hypothetical protein
MVASESTQNQREGIELRQNRRIQPFLRVFGSELNTVKIDNFMVEFCCKHPLMFSSLSKEGCPK